MRRHFFLFRPRAYRPWPRLYLFRWPHSRAARPASARAANPAPPSSEPGLAHEAGSAATGGPAHMRATAGDRAGGVGPAPHTASGLNSGGNPWRKLLIGLGAVLVAAALSVYLLDILIWPTLRTLTEAEIQNTAVAAMYEAVSDEVSSSGLDYRDLFRVETNQAGQVTFMQPDTAAVNEFSAEVAVGIQEKLADLGGQRIEIPLGRALGSRLFGAVGPRIPVTVYPIMLEDVHIWDAFESAGINQTRHRIYLEVNLTVETAIPFISSQVAVEGDFPIAEAVIVGEVPRTYVNGAWLPFFPAGNETAGEETSPGD